MIMSNGRQMRPPSDFAYRTIVSNGKTYWRRAVTLTNLVQESSEIGYSWADTGSEKKKFYLTICPFKANRMYYIRSNYSCWGYQANSSYKAQLSMIFGNYHLGTKSGNGSHDTVFSAGHVILAGTDLQQSLLGELERSASSQGGVATQSSMVVDITDLYAAGYTTAEAVWQRIGFFRGEKVVEL